MKKRFTIIYVIALALILLEISSSSIALSKSQSTVYHSAAQPLSEINFTVGSKEYKVGKVKKTMDVVPFTKDARTLIPIRYVVEAIGGKIEWSQNTQETSITVDSTNIIMRVGEPTATVNGVVTPIDSTNPKVMPLNVGRRVFIPLRFVLETIKAEVIWNPYGRLITIRYPKPELFLFDGAKYSVKYPSNWKRETDKDDVLLMSPEGNNIMVMVEHYESTVTVDEYYDAFLVNMKKINKGMKILSQTTVSVSGLEGRKITYTVSDNGLILKMTQIITAKDKDGYLIGYLADNNLYSNYEKTFDDVQSSLAIK
jgi:hypothetical protein